MNNEDAISRAGLLSRFTFEHGDRIPEVDCDNFPVTVSIKDVKRIIMDAPTIPPPVVHGRWVNSDIDGMLTCSNCKGCDTTSDYLMDTGFSFCPNCGAKMDGGDNHESN